LIYYQDKSALYYFTAFAYFKALNFENAKKILKKTIATNGKWREKSNNLYLKINNIELAKIQYTVSGIAQKIAVKQEVYRADVAALLVDEFSSEKFLSKKEITFLPYDVKDNIYKDEILDVISWGIRGFQPIYSKSYNAYLFEPFRPVTNPSILPLNN
jgi:hypothetical protein